MSAYLAREWSEFGVAVVGAAAALGGLLFVAVSINIERIVAYPTLPARAGQTLIMFAFPLVLGIWILVPDRSTTALGSNLVGTGIVAGAALLYLSRPAARSHKEPIRGWLLSRLLPSAAILILVTLAGVNLITESGPGLYWIPTAVVIAFVAGLVNAWVLLVEILR